MPYYQEILLPVDAKYYSFIIKDKTYNSNHDIVWSINFSLSDTIDKQVGLCTFLTPLSNNTTDIQPGHFLGTALSGDATMSILSNGEIKAINPFGVVNIAFDSTGLYALSTLRRDGLSAHQIKTNALIIRGCNNDVLLNTNLDSTGFSFNNTNQIVRCIFSNAEQRLSVSYRNISSTEFLLLTSIQLPYRVINNSNTDNLGVGFTYSSPISTTSSLVSKMLLYNVATDGVENNTNIITISSAILS